MIKKPVPKSNHNELRELINWHPIRIDAAFKAAGVHRTTWRRWLSGASQIPKATLELIRIKVCGELTDPAFSGFYTFNGVLVDDCGREYTPGDIRACQYYKQLACQWINIRNTHDIIPKRRELPVKGARLPENDYKKVK